MQDTLLSLHNVNFSIKEKNILQNISLNISRNEIITIVGPNGAGKSTLLSLALGLKKATSGTIKMHKDIRIGYVPQLINRDSSMPITVNDFVKLSNASTSPQITEALFTELDLQDLSQSLLCDLSGGELRRVLLLRALLNKPDLLILDEPTAGVDVAGQASFYKHLTKWRDKQKFSILMVSHDLHLVMSSTDRVICLNKHICCQGEPMHVVNDKEYTSLFGQTIYQHHDNVGSPNKHSCNHSH